MVTPVIRKWLGHQSYGGSNLDGGLDTEVSAREGAHRVVCERRVCRAAEYRAVDVEIGAVCVAVERTARVVIQGDALMSAPRGHRVEPARVLDHEHPDRAQVLRNVHGVRGWCADVRVGTRARRGDAAVRGR